MRNLICEHTSFVMNSDVADNTEDKKRDWKDEKKELEETVIKQDNIEDETLEDPEKKMDKSAGEENPQKGEASEKNEKDNAKTTGKKSEARHAESRYAEVPMSHMFCHICNKHMWDGFVRIDESKLTDSFHHLRGNNLIVAFLHSPSRITYVDARIN